MLISLWAASLLALHSLRVVAQEDTDDLFDDNDDEPRAEDNESGVPNELFSNLIPQKLLKTAEQISQDFKYPEMTNGEGKWILEPANRWSAGFVPASLYALQQRTEFCKPTQENGLALADWRKVGQATSDGLIPLTKSNGVGHDVGFLSFPFVEELRM